MVFIVGRGRLNALTANLHLVMRATAVSVGSTVRAVCRITFWILGFASLVNRSSKLVKNALLKGAFNVKMVGI